MICPLSCEPVNICRPVALDVHNQQSHIAADVTSVTDKAADQDDLLSHLQTVSEQLDGKLTLCFITQLPMQFHS